MCLEYNYILKNKALQPKRSGVKTMYLVSIAVYNASPAFPVSSLFGAVRW